MEVIAPWTATDAGGGTPPCDMPSWPCNPDGTGTNTHNGFTQNTTSQPYIALAHLALDRQEYLDSLIPPSAAEIARIAGVQAINEAQNKRRERIRRRIAEQASLQRYRHDAYLKIPPEQSFQTQAQSNESLGSSGYTGHSSSRNSSISSHAGVINTDCPSTTSRSRSTSVGDDDDDDAGQYSRPVSLIPHHSHHHHEHNQHPKTMNASTRWSQALREAQFRTLTAPRSRNGLTPDIIQSLPPGCVFDDGSDGLGLGLSLLGTGSRPATARQRWRKAIAVACRAGFDGHPGDRGSADDDWQSELDFMSSDSEADACGDESEHLAKQKRKAAKKARYREEAKVINELYLLELVDHKHRYGLNLFVYHQQWKRAETRENFFYWLDHGEGHFIDLEVCSRDKLDREQIRYLSHEEQQLYLVVVGSGGRLCWAKNGLPVDTSDKWRDSINGIVSVDDPTPAFTPPYLAERGISFGQSSNSSSRAASDWSTASTYATSLSSESVSGEESSTEQAQQDEKEVAPSDSSPTDHRQSQDSSSSSASDSFSKPPPLPPRPPRQQTTSKAIQRIKYGNSTAGLSWVIDKFLKQNWGANPWIFVSDSSSRLYVGIKDSGTFQHTSFVRGSRVSAAGMISVREGVLEQLSPLSGHYRPGSGSFRGFVKELKGQGVATAGGPLGEGGGIGGLEFLGRDYLLLRGFEIYSRVRGVFGWGVGAKAGDEEGSDECEVKGGGTKARRRVLVKKPGVSRMNSNKAANKKDNDIKARPNVVADVDGISRIDHAPTGLSQSSRSDAGSISGKGKDAVSSAAHRKMVLRKLHRATSMPISDVPMAVKGKEKRLGSAKDGMKTIEEGMGKESKRPNS